MATRVWQRTAAGGVALLWACHVTQMVIGLLLRTAAGVLGRLEVLGFGGGYAGGVGGLWTCRVPQMVIGLRLRTAAGGIGSLWMGHARRVATEALLHRIAAGGGVRPWTGRVRRTEDGDLAKADTVGKSGGCHGRSCEEDGGGWVIGGCCQVHWAGDVGALWTVMRGGW
ncbi:hypothetical protein CYMTET_2941 [Cymbomonas tetramitiformis]|uniref:Uncharacterized protein n=1 Tax=Cymbomonas tetramitiformis TaxID=36881 RepID=A0AAE0LLK6_9CHLO|nr:hypothetical protein CYMTET_2941 [Cymbomonas tetramitiformis]